MRRGDARRLALHIPDAWYDYHDALELWSTVEASERLASDGEDFKVDMDEWRRRGVRLYTYLVLLPTRHGGVFHSPPAHDELLAIWSAACNSPRAAADARAPSTPGC